MKKIYTLLSILFIGLQVSDAQLTLTFANNNPIVGDITNMARYDSISVVPKTVGIGQNWNFSNLTIGGFTETITYTTVVSTPQAASFPLATIAMIRGTNNYEYYKQSAGMIEYTGQADPNGKVVFSNLATWNNWPIAYGNSNTDSFAGLETTSTQTNNWSGTLSYTASGTGTVTLPGGYMHTNCLQLKKSITLNLTGSTTATMSITQYHYYSSSNKYPILTAEYQSMTSGTTTSTQVDIFVNTGAMSVGINENKVSSANNFIVYPNPASNEVNVFLPNNDLASSIDVIDVTGKIVATSLNANSINVSTLAKAVYTIRVKTKDSILQRSLAVTE